MPRHDPTQVQHARELRRNATRAESVLWRELRNRRSCPFRFRRQHPIGPFIVDFYCAESGVVIELDGDSHLGREPYDRARQKWLEARGLLVLRFTNIDVTENLDGVLEVVAATCAARATSHPGTPHPGPLPGGERGPDAPEPRKRRPARPGGQGEPNVASRAEATPTPGTPHPGPLPKGERGPDAEPKT